MVKRNKKKVQNKDNNLDNKIFKNFFDTKKYRAIIYNKAGEQIATIQIDRSKKTFNHKNFKYVVDWNCKTYFKRSNFFNTFKYFHYFIDNPNPIEFDGDNFITPPLNTEVFNELFDTKVTKDLNNVANGLGAFLTPKNILIGLAVIGIAYYFLSGGTIT